MSEEKKVTFSDYLYVLYKWKKFLIINIVIITAIGVGVSFLIPKTYKATATIMLPPNSQGGMGGLSSLISGGGGILSMGAGLLGGESAPEDLIFGLLNSRSTLDNVIDKFNLMKYYEITDNNYDKTRKIFAQDLVFEPNEHGMIAVSVINKSPQVSSLISNYFVKLVDSLHLDLNARQAKNNRVFIEQRYTKNLNDLKAAEDSLFSFQTKYGIFAVPEQLEASVKAAAEIEGLLTEKEISLYLIESKLGKNSPQYKDILTETKFLRDKVKELKFADQLSSVSNILLPFKEFPEIMIQYLRLYRDIEIQSKILEITLPMFEQAKVEEQKNIPTILIVDKAIPPQLKYAPKKSLVVMAFFFIGFFLFVIFVFRAEKILQLEVLHNPLEEKEKRIFSRVAKIYHLSKSQ